MTNPWFDIPLSDYESHMALPDVGQAAMLASQLETVLLRYAPESVAVIGCAGGNGFDRIPASVRRVVGIDINPRYIAAATARHHGRVPGLELHVADIQAGLPPCAPVELIHAALVFEYVSLPDALANLARLCLPGGRLVVVLQRPSACVHEVSPSPYTSVQRLAPVMRLVPPEELRSHAAASGFALESEHTEVLVSGKEFVVQVHRCASDASPRSAADDPDLRHADMQDRGVGASCREEPREEDAVTGT